MQYPGMKLPKHWYHTYVVPSGVIKPFKSKGYLLVIVNFHMLAFLILLNAVCNKMDYCTSIPTKFGGAVSA